MRLIVSDEQQGITVLEGSFGKGKETIVSQPYGQEEVHVTINDDTWMKTGK